MGQNCGEISSNTQENIMLDYQSELCRSWVQDKAEVTRVYFYGSRVWGSPRTKSDLDVFIVAQPGAVIGSAQEWTNELTSLLAVTVHINDHFTADPKLIDKIKESGLLVVSRHGCDVDFKFEDELSEFDPDAD
jgi:predicted nucleotidyltransferase